MRPFYRHLIAALLLWPLIAGRGAIGQVPITTPGKKDVDSGRLDRMKKAAPKTTFIEFELLQSLDGGGLPAQQWIKVLEPLDVSLRVHRPILNDKPDLKERTAGNLRFVTAIGTLDRSGKIAFPDKSFDLADTVKLKEWIDELRTYGVRGNPDGQPLWGLTKDQFSNFFDGLSIPIQLETEGKPLAELVAKLPFSKPIPLHWTADASELLARRGERTKIRHELNGFSIGQVLSISLGENGLGFRPQRTPNGDIELLIEPKTPKHEQWPVGWPVQQRTSKAVPKLYAMVPIELSDVELSDVISAVSKLSQTPVLVDYAELDASQIDVEKIRVSFPRKITTWSIVLSRIVVPQKLTREYWQDEAGHVFVWITTASSRRSKEADKTDP